MNYIDTVFWLHLEILDIFNSSAKRYWLLTSQTTANTFNVSNASQTSIYIKEMA